MITGSSIALRMVPMLRCIEAYIRLIEDDSLDGMYILTVITQLFLKKTSPNNIDKKTHTMYIVGDVVVVTSRKTYTE